MSPVKCWARACLLRYFHAREVSMSVSGMSAGVPEEQEPMDTASGRMDADESTASNVQIKFEEICQGLNLDKQAQEKAWDSYMRLSEKYGLEVSTGPCNGHVTHLPASFTSSSVMRGTYDTTRTP